MFKFGNWITHLLSLICLMFCYCFLPYVVDLINQGGFSIFVVIVLLPVVIISLLITLVFVSSCFIKMFFNQRWYFILLNILNLVLFVLIVLTCLGVIPNVI